MPKALFIGGMSLCVLTCGLLAQSPQQAPEPPAILAGQQIPVAAFARYEGKHYPIHRASNLVPKIKVGEKIRSAEVYPRVRLLRANSFGLGSVAIESAELTFWTCGEFLTHGVFEGADYPISLSFTGKLVSETDLKDCFIVLVFVRTSTLETDAGEAPFYVAGVSEIGTLKAGKRKNVRVDYDYSLLKNFPKGDLNWFVTVQSGPSQIHSTGAHIEDADRLILAQRAWVARNK